MFHLLKRNLLVRASSASAFETDRALRARQYVPWIAERGPMLCLLWSLPSVNLVYKYPRLRKRVTQRTLFVNFMQII